MLQEENKSFDSLFKKRKKVYTENLIFINQLFLYISSTGTWLVSVIISEM